jgi:hypothetical protein
MRRRDDDLYEKKDGCVEEQKRVMIKTKRAAGEHCSTP